MTNFTNVISTNSIISEFIIDTYRFNTLSNTAFSILTLIISVIAIVLMVRRTQIDDIVLKMKDLNISYAKDIEDVINNLESTKTKLDFYNVIRYTERLFKSKNIIANIYHKFHSRLTIHLIFNNKNLSSKDKRILAISNLFFASYHTYVERNPIIGNVYISEAEKYCLQLRKKDLHLEINILRWKARINRLLGSSKKAIEDLKTILSIIKKNRKELYALDTGHLADRTKKSIANAYRTLFDYKNSLKYLLYILCDELPDEINIEFYNKIIRKYNHNNEDKINRDPKAAYTFIGLAFCLLKESNDKKSDIIINLYKIGVQKEKLFYAEDKEELLYNLIFLERVKSYFFSSVEKQEIIDLFLYIKKFGNNPFKPNYINQRTRIIIEIYDYIGITPEFAPIINYYHSKIGDNIDLLSLYQEYEKTKNPILSESDFEELLERYIKK